MMESFVHDRESHGRLHVLRWLLWEAEMPALERASSGALALHYAAARGCLDCVKLLMEASPQHSANAQMENAVTPVYLAAQEGHLDVLRYLVSEAGGSLLLRAKDGMAPLHAAAQMGCLPCLKWMVQEQGVDPDLRDGDGATALHFAASRGHAETVRWLLRHGARLLLDKFGKSPLNDAAENEQIECLSILVQHGTTPDYSDQVARNTAKTFVCSRPREDSNQKNSLLSSDSSSINSEPFYLHPPSSPGGPLSPCSPCGTSCGSSLPSSLGGHEIYINPMASPQPASRSSSSGSECSFYLHNPKEVIYNRVKDLFEVTGGRTPSPPRPNRPGSSASSTSVRSSPDGSTTVVVGPSGAVTVRVDVHTSDVSSELSEASAAENDYEDIYQVRPAPDTENKGNPRRRHSGASVVNIVQADVHHSAVTSVQIAGPEPPPLPRDISPVRPQKCVVEMSGVCEPQPLADKTPIGTRLSLPAAPPAPPEKNKCDRALKRVVSEPTGLQCPPPPPLPPPVATAVPTTESGTKLQTTGSRATVDEQTEAENKPLFVPPKFPTTNSESLIKPSEYLRSLGGKAAVSTPPQCPTLPEEGSSAAGPPPPPPPPKTQQQPLAAISVHELTSVQLRRTERLGKTLSAPTGPAPASTVMSPAPGATVTSGFRSQKDDLIAELKRSRDISGIRQIRVERARSEEREEKERFTKISKQFSVESFVEQVPDHDATGNPIPPWKRQMLAKKAAERAKKEAEERAQREAEEHRIKSIPVWKRQLLAQRKETTPETTRNGGYAIRLLPENTTESSGESTVTPIPETDKENDVPVPANKPAEEDASPTPIIPWRAQLRKTNSTLNLLE